MPQKTWFIMVVFNKSTEGFKNLRKVVLVIFVFLYPLFFFRERKSIAIRPRFTTFVFENRLATKTAN